MSSHRASVYARSGIVEDVKIYTYVLSTRPLVSTSIDWVYSEVEGATVILSLRSLHWTTCGLDAHFHTPLLGPLLRARHTIMVFASVLKCIQGINRTVR